MPKSKMVSMERTAAEKKQAEELCKANPCEGPDYPWGLALNLGKEELDKLGVKGLPEIGEEFQIVATAKVTRVSQSANASGDEHKGVELQIIEMGVTDPDAAQDETEASPTATKLYGKTGKGENAK